ncbi:MAG: V-type ATP synthase subunit E family protein [Candidatus Paceibacterota bacterium]
MALTDITQKILADAQTQASEIKKDTATQVAVIERETSEQKNALKREHDAAVERDKEHRRRQERARAEQAKKRAVEVTKRENIDSVFTDVKEKLAQLPGEEYQKLITSLLNELPDDATGTLYAPATRIPETKEALATARRSGLSLTEDADLEGGFRITGERADYDYSFERLIEDIRDRQELAVAQALFPNA